MGMAYFFYTLAAVFENKGNTMKIIIWTSLPGTVYFLLVIMNLFSNVLFSICPDGTYTPVSYTHLDVYKRQGTEWHQMMSSMRRQ